MLSFAGSFTVILKYKISPNRDPCGTPTRINNDVSAAIITLNFCVSVSAE